VLDLVCDLDRHRFCISWTNMRCLSDKESAVWCGEYGYPVMDVGYYGRPAPLVDEQFELIRFTYPIDSGQRVRLARDVVEWLAKSGGTELLFWVDQWDVWPRSQHLPVFARFREAFGETRPLIQSPGHLFRVDELDDALSVLVVALLFIWDCHVFSAIRSPVFFCCHDEWSGLFVPPGYDPTLISTAFSSWLLKDDGVVSP